MAGFISFGDLVSKNIGVGQSDRLAPKIHQNTESLKFSIGQNNLNGKFRLNLTSHYIRPFITLDGTRATVVSQECRRVSSFKRGASGQSYQRPRPYGLAAATVTSTATLIATAILRLTTLRLTRNAPMSVIAWKLGLQVQRLLLVAPQSIEDMSISICVCFFNVWNTEPKRKVAV